MLASVTGFYAFLDQLDETLADALVRPVSAGGCGATVLQVRRKPFTPDGVEVAVPDTELLALARLARTVCRTYKAVCIVNDRLDIALAVGADGVHLGQRDLPLAHAREIVDRQRLERPFVIGITTNTRAQVEAACAGGADYLGFGPVFATRTKLDADPVRGLDGLRSAVQAAGSTPVVGIGGIQPVHAANIARTGARAACVISAVNRADDRSAAGATVGAAFASR